MSAVKGVFEHSLSCLPRESLQRMQLPSTNNHHLSKGMGAARQLKTNAHTQVHPLSVYSCE